MPDIKPIPNVQEVPNPTNVGDKAVAHTTSPKNFQTVIGRLFALFSLMVISYSTFLITVTIHTKAGKEGGGELDDGFAFLAPVFITLVLSSIIFIVDAARQKTRGHFVKGTYLPVLIVIILISFLLGLL